MAGAPGDVVASRKMDSRQISFGGDPIARLQEAEAQAERLLSEAKRRASERLEQIHFEARRRVARARKEAQEEARRRIDERLERARAEAQALQRQGEQEAAAVEARAQETFERAVRLVLERVFPFPWDWPA